MEQGGGGRPVPTFWPELAAVACQVHRQLSVVRGKIPEVRTGYFFSSCFGLLWGGPHMAMVQTNGTSLVQVALPILEPI